jgi:nicotinamidase-related amidase
MELSGAVRASQSAARLLAHFRKKNLAIAHVQHISLRPGATFFLPNTEGINFHESVAPSGGEPIVIKHFPNSFRETNLQEILESSNIRELVICGMMSHMCIDATVRAAFDKAYTCFVAHDACATRNLSHNGDTIEAKQVHGAFMAALHATYATVLTVDEIIGMV